MNPSKVLLYLFVPICFISVHFLNLGEVFGQDADNIVLLKQKAETLKAEENQDDLNQTLVELTEALWGNGQIDEAIGYYGEIIELNKQIGNDNAIAYAYSQIGLLRSEQGKIQESITQYNTAIALRRKMKDKQGLSSLLVTLGIIQKEHGIPDKAIENLEEALALSRALNNSITITDCLRSLASLYEEKGETEKAFAYQKEYTESIKIEETITRNELAEQFNEESKQKDAQLSIVNSKLEDAALREERATALALAKAKEVELLNEAKKLQELTLREQDARIKAHKMMINSFIGGGSMVLALSSLLFVGYRQNRKARKKLAFQNEEITQKNEEIILKRDALQEHSRKLQVAFQDIRSSINYAKKIQMAMMPSAELLKSGLKDSFIFFKPRDVVSGDFYWYTEQGGKIIIAAVDCTGHGVPGAFMSMIGSNILHQIVNERGVVEADEILNMLSLRIVNALHQDVTQNKDGMDAALCVIEPAKKELSFAGAKNPLVMISGDDIKVIKGDKMSIGGSLNSNSCRFTKHTIPIEKTTMCYIYSDGFQDQFGGEHKRKYMSVNFRKLLAQISKEPFDMQNQILNEELEDWMTTGEEEQIDDILVLGFKLSF